MFTTGRLRARGLGFAALLIGSLLSTAWQSPAFASQGVLDEARRALASDRPEAALSLLETLDEGDVEDPVDLAFLRGVALIEAGRPEDAADVLEPVVARFPHLVRIRLEMARAYFESGNDSAAERQFRQVLGGRLPVEVRQTVIGFLERIRTRRTWSGEFRFGIAPDTNITAATSDRTITILGEEFVLSDDARKTSGIGIEASGRAQLLLLNPTNPVRPVISGSAFHRNYEGDKFDDLSLSLFAGADWRTQDGTVAAGPRVGRRWFGGKPYQDTYGLEISADRQLGSRLFGSGSIFAGRTRLLGRSDGKATVVNAVAGVTRPIGPATTIGLTGLVRREVADEERRSFWRVGAQAALSQELPWGFRVTLRPSFTMEKRDAEHPFFGAAEDKKTYTGEVSVANRLITFKGFSPYLSVQHTYQTSDVSLYEFSRSRVLLGAESRF